MTVSTEAGKALRARLAGVCMKAASEGASDVEIHALLQEQIDHMIEREIADWSKASALIGRA